MKRVGIKSGAFSLIHAGHVWAIQQCAQQCDYLIILNNDDEYIARKKGVVVIPLIDRLYILKNIHGVMEVGSFSGDSEHNWIKDFRENRMPKEFPDWELIVFHSDELVNKTNGNLPGFGYCDKIIFIPRMNRPESVTKIFREIRGSCE